MCHVNGNQVVPAPNNVTPSHEMVNSGYPHEMANSGYIHFNPMQQQQVVTSSDPLSCLNVGHFLMSLSLWFCHITFCLIIFLFDYGAELSSSFDVQNLYSSLGVWLKAIHNLTVFPNSWPVSGIYAKSLRLAHFVGFVV